MDALKNNSEKLNGARIYFIRLDGENEISFAGKPYCTICSKMALDIGIKRICFVSYRKVSVYDTEEYNDLSFNFEV